ncbi:MAG: histidine kinase dimerization/phospho-acceptor domain-containing protein [Spirochaetota bacterium]
MTQRETEQLVRNISHEIKNPLTAIKGYAQLIRIKGDDQEFLRKTNVIICDQIQRIEAIFSDIHGIFNLSLGDMSSCSLLGTVNALVSFLPPDIASKIRLSGGSDISVCIDPALFSRAVSGLLRGFDWRSSPDVTVQCSIGPMSDGRACVDLRFTGFSFSSLDNETFYLPWGSCMYYPGGLDLYACFYIITLMKGRFLLNGDHDGFIIII